MTNNNRSIQVLLLVIVIGLVIFVAPFSRVTTIIIIVLSAYYLTYYRKDPSIITTSATYNNSADNPESLNQKSKITASAIQFRMPFWIEVYDPIKMIRRVQYAFIINESTLLSRSPAECITAVSSSLSVSNILLESTSHLKKQWKINRDLHLVESLLLQEDENNRDLTSLLTRPSSVNSLISSRFRAHESSDIGVVVSYRHLHRIVPILESEVYRVISKTLVRQEWAVVGKDVIEFYRTNTTSLRRGGGKPLFRISRTDIIDLSLTTSLPNFPNVEVLVIETLVKAHYVAGVENVTEWVNALQNNRNRNAKPVQHYYSVVPDPNFPPIENRLVINDKWTVGQRISQKTYDAVEFSKTLLKRALSLLNDSNSDISDDLLEFISLLDLLQTVNVSELNQSSKTCFYINLYHIMICHAIVVKGYLPDSKKSWALFLKSTSVILLDKVVAGAISLYEIQCSVFNLSGPFNNPINTDTKDFRVGFALCPGGKWMTNEIEIYSPEKLDDQLNEAVRRVLSTFVTADVARKTIYLPRIIEWLAPDIIISDDASLVDVTSFLYREFMRTSNHLHKNAIETILSDKTNRLIHIKFIRADFKPHLCLKGPPPPVTTDSDFTVTNSSSKGLRIRYVSEGQRVEVRPNTAEPVEFENEYFVGKILFLLQNNDESSPWNHIFAGKRRLFWVKIQGRFKVKPSAIVYMGGEVPAPMNLGVVAKTCCKVMLGVIKSIVPSLHTSFGSTSSTTTTQERPHIAFPLYTAVDSFSSTKESASPPSLASADFNESPEARSIRKKTTESRDGGRLFDFNTTDVISIQFHSYFINFATWQVVSVPGLPDMDLKTFWKEMPLRIVAYENNTAMTGKKKKEHFTLDNRYFFEFELSYED